MNAGVRGLLILVSALVSPAAAHAQRDAPVPRRPVHTFSIVARDPATGELGVAVQSHWFNIGPLVPWVEAGVGAIATQSFVDPSYGKLGLDLMRAGRSAPEALKALIAGDAASDVRQVAMIDAQGRVAAHTGAKDIQAAGHKVGVNYSVQANLMLNDSIWPAMSRAFEAAKGDLADRMLAALDAAQAAGGDIRGRQSAALVIVSGKPTGKPWIDRTFDLRVDDSPEPLKELRRLVVLQRAYNHMNAGDLARIFGRRRTRARQRGDGVLARRCAREHGARGRIAAALPPGVQGGQELGDADAAPGRRRPAAEGSGRHRSDRQGRQLRAPPRACGPNGG